MSENRFLAEFVMPPSFDFARQSRRDFLTSSANGIGLAALATLFQNDGLLASEGTEGERNQKAGGRSDGQSAHVRPARAMRHGIVRVAAAHLDLCR